MGLLVVGLNHKSAPVEVREKLAFRADEIPDALMKLRRYMPDISAVIVSTCNRVEIYLCDDGKAIEPDRLHPFIAEHHQLEQDSFVPHLYFHQDAQAINHLFRVASGLDSMVLGESQILAQVKDAYTIAAKNGAVGKTLHSLFQKAFKVAKDVQTSTRIGEGKVSVSSVAVGLAESIFQDFSDKTVLVIGAGEMSELTIKHLLDKGATTFIVANRSREKAEELANEYNGHAIGFDLLDDYLSRADIIISSTSAPHYVIHPEQVKRAMKARRYRPCFLIDIAVPRDIHPDVNKIENVYLYDIDDLEQEVQRNIGEREREVEKCLAMIEKECEKFLRSMEEKKVEPELARLRERYHQIRQKELQWLFPKLPDLKEEEKKKIEQATERMVNKLLHDVVQSTKAGARDGQGHWYVEAIRKVFGTKMVN